VDLERALRQAMLESGAPDLDALYEHLAGSSGRAALDTLVEALTIGETHFFRNRPQFEALAGHILPELIKRRRASRQLRLWSAGCASGEEPYSLAILLEQLLPDLAEWQVLILATDLNRQALAKAERGVYSPWSFREVPPGVQASYFVPRGREFEIAPRLRQRVTFANLNLVTDSYPSPLNQTQNMDLILFRNVVIYFRPETTRVMVARMHAALAEGGWLVVGHADNGPGLFEQFQLHNFPGTVVYRKEKEKERDAPREKSGGRVTPSWLLGWPAPSPVVAAVAPRPAAQAPAPAPDRYAEAQALRERGRLDEALALLAALAAAEPAEARAPYLAARIRANRQQMPEAEQLVTEALRRAPLHAPAHYLYSLILQETGRPELALGALRRCVYADPQFVLGHFALANLLAQSGQPERARKALENVTRWLDTHPRETLLPEGDGLTAGRLIELMAEKKVTGQ
jgi:chemotaxis protein methyltransferase CheR